MSKMHKYCWKMILILMPWIVKRKNDYVSVNMNLSWWLKYSQTLFVNIVGFKAKLIKNSINHTENLKVSQKLYERISHDNSCCAIIWFSMTEFNVAHQTDTQTHWISGSEANVINSLTFTNELILLWKWFQFIFVFSFFSVIYVLDSHR